MHSGSSLAIAMHMLTGVVHSSVLTSKGFLYWFFTVEDTTEEII
jgi:hypothetical protein